MSEQGRGGIVYGTDKGTIGHLCNPGTDGGDILRKTWELSAGGATMSVEGSGRRGVTALKSFDLTQDGVEELIAGREDGSVTVRLASAASIWRHGPTTKSSVLLRGRQLFLG